MLPPKINRDKYQELIVRRAVKAANKQSRRSQKELDLESIRNLKVATASPWSRIVIGLLGIILLGATIHAQVTDVFSWFLSIVALIGVYFIVVAIRGRKKRVSEIETALDAIDAGGSLIECIVENIDISIDF